MTELSDAGVIGIQERYPLTPLQHGMLLGSLLAPEAGVEAQPPVPPIRSAPRDPRAEPRFGARELRLSPAADAALHALERDRGVSVSTAVQGAWALLLGRYTGSTEAVFGTVRHGLKGAEGMVGLLTDIVPIRVPLPPAARVTDWLEEIAARNAALGPHQHAALPDLQRWSGLPQGVPLFDTVVDDQPLPFEAAFQGTEGRSVGVREHPGYRLALSLDAEAPLRACIRYDADLFDAAAVDRMLGHFARLLEEMAADPERPLGALDLLGEAERSTVLEEWNRTGAEFPADACLHELFEAHAERDPQAAAVLFGGESLAYGELDARAGRLANHLRAHGVGPEVRVGICLERGPELVAAILGVLKAGGAYVPLDPAYPAERLGFMLASAGVSVLLTQESVRGVLPAAGGVAVVSVDGDRAAIAAEPAEVPESGVEPRNLAYVIFTSGSTGVPKGIALAHRGVVNNLTDLNRGWGVGADDRVLLLSSLSFDMSVYETLGILAAGGAVVVPTAAELREPGAWAGLMRRHAVTVWNSAPALLGMLVDHLEAHPADAPPALRLAFLGGDWVPVALPDRLRAHCPGMDVVVMGGATEASIHSIIFPVRETDPAWKSIPYGAPMANQRAYVLDERLRPVPVGVPGELYLAGTGLARGYTGRPDLTAERFLPEVWGLEPGARMYRTGDRARWKADGNLELIGRLDHQVKIRGFRIETGEIETALRRHPAVERAVVVSRGDGGEGRLVAYLVPDPAHAPLPARLLRMQATAAGAAAAWSELPNGLPVAHLNEGETTFSFREVWEDRVYLRHGITVADGDCVFDVGANIGLFTLLAGCRWRGVRIFAFEPIPPVFETLRLNAELHGVSARLFNCGLSRQDGSARFTYYPHLSIVSGQFADTAEESEVVRAFMRGRGAAPGAGEVVGEELDELVDSRLEHEAFTCRLRTLSSVIREEGVERIDLLKVDAEKAEEEVLAGIDDDDWPKIRQVVVEVHDHDGRLARLRALLERHGFLVEAEQDSVLEQTPFHNLYARRPDSGERGGAEDTGAAGEWTSVGRLVAGVREHLRRNLPEYMVPAAYVALDRLPLSPNGKVDRRQLPDPPAPAERAPYVAPRTPAEATLAEIWAEVLGVERVGAGDDFLALGGHSLAAARVAGRVRERLGVQLPLGEFFRVATLAELAAAVGLAEGAGAAPIPPAPGDGPFPLAPAQRRLWLWEQMNPGRAAYNIPVALRLRGPLDAAVLERALDALVRRHAVLRTVFVVRDGDPVQRIVPESPFVLSTEPLPAADDALRRRLAEEGARPFDLGRGPLFRALLLAGGGEHVLLLTCHHLVSDGWSTGILLRELSVLYGAFVRGEPSPLPELPLRYADYAVWHHARVAEAEAAQLAWWAGHLAGAPELLELPTDRPRPAVQSHRGAHHPIHLPAALVERARALGRQEGATLHAVLLAALYVVLGRHARAERVVVGSAPAGRTHPDTEALAGFFVNTLPIAADLSADPGFRAFLRQVRTVTLEAYDRQDVPFDRLVEALAPGRNRSHTPLVQVAFAFQDAPARGFRLGAARAAPVSVDLGTAQFDLTFLLDQDEHGVAGVLEYATDLFDAATAERIAARLGVLLEAAVADPERRLSRLPLLRPGERESLVGEWSGAGERFPVSGALHHRFEARAAAHPDALALSYEGETLTYGELNARANRLARRLRALGVAPESRVGLCAERSLDLVAGILAIVKAGAAYVPLDPAYPPERLAYMAEDSGIRVLLAQRALAGRVPAAGIEVLALEDVPADELPDDLGVAVSPENLAYVIYTSGSTGRPKGVGVTHGNVLRLFDCTQPSFGFSEADVWTLFHSYAFDFSVWETWGALLYGGRLVVVPWAVSRDPGAFRALLKRERVTVLNQTPSAFRALAAVDEGEAEPLDALRTVVFGGEALQYESLRGWLDRYGPKRPRLVNMYGITETTVHVTWHTVTGRELRDAGAGSGVGAAIPDLRAYVLDPAGEPAPTGVPGELHVGGAGLARGYLGRPGLTAERFVPDPFSGGEGARLYRSGDLARWKADGTLEYLGRIDQQVKIRGFRIELGEIESLLLAQPGVAAAAVIVRGEGDDAALAAYLVPAGKTLPHAELRDALRKHLPEHMVPAAFVAVDRIPLTANGKLDRAALPAPDAAGVAPADGFVAPRTPAEEVLAGIWCEVLRRDRVGVTENFFELGGHSLLATRAVSRIAELFAVEPSVAMLFEAPTVEELAERVEALRRAGAPVLPPIVPVPRGDALPLSFAQERLWFLDRLQPGSAVYNLPLVARLTGALDAAALERALGEVVRRHEALRTTFAEADGQPVQVIAPFAGFALPLEDLSGLDAGAREAAVEARTAEEAVRPFDLAAGPLFRPALLRLGAEEHVLLLSMHHVVSDEWSTEVLFAELAALYGAFREGRASPLPEPAVQYADFAAWQRRVMAGEVLDGRLAWWRERLAGAPAQLELPTDHPHPAVQSYRGARAERRLPAGLLERLRALGRSAGVTEFMLLLGAFKALLARYGAGDDLVVGSPAAGQTRRELEALVGCFVNTLVLRTDLSGDPGFRELLRRVRETTLGAWEHQDVPFERLVAELAPERSLSRSPLFQVMFVQENAGPKSAGLPGLEMRRGYTESATSKFDLMLSIDDGLAALEYATDLFEPATAERMLAHLERVLEQVAADPGVPLSALALAGPEERALVLAEWNRTDAEYPAHVCAHELFEAQAARTPGAVALRHAGGSLTYAELEERANRLARRLRGLGVGPDARVGLCLERGPDLMIGVLGILKAGGAYVPLDPVYPAERLAYMLEDSAARVLLTQASLVERLPAGGATVVRLDADAGEIERESGDRLGVPVAPGNLAYVIYTSGSTGRPKGVAMPHRPLVNLLAWQEGSGRAPAGAVTLQYTSISFDVSFQEIFSTWCAGGTLVLTTEEVRADPSQLARLLEAEGVGRLFLPFVALQHLAEASVELGIAPASLAEVITAGEQLRVTEPIRRWFTALPGCVLVNQYGPSETHVVSARELDGAPAGWPLLPSIGAPVANTALYVLDQHLEPAPIGVPGELLLGGDAVARGYLARPGLTAERFVPDPFGAPGGRLYRTGDRARWLASGEVEYLGRTDEQVKIRGFRIEPGEVEAVLSDHPEVREAVVVVREDAAGDRRLVGYVVAAEPAAVTPAELREHLKGRLPEYMVPSAFVVLDSLPLTPSGKVARRALPAPDLAWPEEAYVAPRTPMEETLAGIWAEVLRLERVGVHDGFFELGGHSLLATRVVSRVRVVFGVELRLRALFETPTVAGLAPQVETLVLEQVEEQKLAAALERLEQLSEDEVMKLLSGE